MSQPVPDPPEADDAADPKGEFPIAPAQYFFYLLFQASRQRDLHFERSLARAGLNVARWRTLAIIRRMGELTMKELALYSTIDRTTLTRAVDQLVAQGLVERTIPARDRRKVCLALSAAGVAAYSRAIPLLRSGNADLLQDSSEAEVRAAARLLQRSVRRMVEDPKVADQLIEFGRAD